MLKGLSLGLLGHGLIGLYDEMLEIFFVLPQIPDFLNHIGYTDFAMEQIYQKTFLVISIASLETIYGLSLLGKGKHFAHRIHFLTGVGVFILSIFVYQQNTEIEHLDTDGYLPKIPNSVNLIYAESMSQRWQLFENILNDPEPNTKTESSDRD